MLVNVASVLNTNSFWPVNLGTFQTALFLLSLYFGLPCVYRSAIRAVFHGVGTRTMLLVANSLLP
jgi:hypothetical protein